MPDRRDPGRKLVELRDYDVEELHTLFPGKSNAQAIRLLLSHERKSRKGEPASEPDNTAAQGSTDRVEAASAQSLTEPAPNLPAGPEAQGSTSPFAQVVTVSQEMELRRLRLQEMNAETRKGWLDMMGRFADQNEMKIQLGRDRLTVDTRRQQLREDWYTNATRQSRDDTVLCVYCGNRHSAAGCPKLIEDRKKWDRPLAELPET